MPPCERYCLGGLCMFRGGFDEGCFLFVLVLIFFFLILVFFLAFGFFNNSKPIPFGPVPHPEPPRHPLPEGARVFAAAGEHLVQHGFAVEAVEVEGDDGGDVGPGAGADVVGGHVFLFLVVVLEVFESFFFFFFFEGSLGDGQI